MMLSPREFQYILRHDFMSFAERAFYELNPQTRFLPGPHLEVIAAKLDACRQGRIKRLIINMPPRGLKSHFASVSLPAWWLGHAPTTQIICASYGQDLAEKFARDCRSVMTSAWYKRTFATRLADRTAVREFVTTEQGCRLATSVGGVLTGRGAEVLILDDPLKPDEALSEVQRKVVNEWFDGTLLTRLNDKTNGCIIIVMQRLHQDDLVGHVLEQGNWEVVSFPAIAQEAEKFSVQNVFGLVAYERSVGEALHAERESLGALATLRATMGDYHFQSQYLQEPTPRDGAMIKREWIAYYDVAPTHSYHVVQSWDTANKSGELNDYSVCTTWMVLSEKFYLIDVFRGRLNYPDLKRKVKALAKSYKPDTIVIEDKASGTQLIQDLRADGVFLIKEIERPAGSDKKMRMHAQSATFESGKVVLPRQAPWLDDYVKELTSFPGGKYDDQVDSTTQALEYLRKYDTIAMYIKLGK